GGEMLGSPFPFSHRRGGDPRGCGVPALAAWVVTSYELVSAALRNPQLSSDRFGRLQSRLVAKGLDVVLDERVKSMIHMDPPDHTRLRGLVNKAFTPRAVEAMTGRIQAIVDELLNAVAPNRQMDVIRDLAYPLPVTVIADR